MAVGIQTIRLQLASKLSQRQPFRLRDYSNHSRTQRRLSVSAGAGEIFSRGFRKLFTPDNDQQFPMNPSPVGRNLYFSNNAPSWEELESAMNAVGQRLGDQSLSQGDYLEVGPPNPLSLKRTFGKSDPIRIKLYRDHGAWCPYCQKVWIQLEEKQIPYQIEKINMRCYGDKPQSFYETCSSGLLPVMELDGKIITESKVIAQILETEFPENPLLPPRGSSAYVKCEQLMQLERKAFSSWCSWLCRAGGDQQKKSGFEAVMTEIESRLGDEKGEYFLGETFSLIDIIFVPFLERMDASLAYHKGYRMRGQGRYPNLDSWFVAMESRASYLATRTDYYTHAFALPPQLGGCVMTRDGESVAKKIRGEGETWSLPLEPLSETSFEPYAPGENPEHDTYMAAKRMIVNRDAVERFALRGCGEGGDRPVMAPLSDPTARPGMHAIDAVDAAFRHVVHALLVGTKEKQTLESMIKTRDGVIDGFLPSNNVIQALTYIRDRVGVPRDLKLPAARQLRAHFNWFIQNVA